MVVWLSNYRLPTAGLKQKTHRRAGGGVLINLVNAQNPAAALVSSAFVSSRFKLRFTGEA
jgi:hypothetical protein